MRGTLIFWKNQERFRLYLGSQLRRYLGGKSDQKSIANRLTWIGIEKRIG